jgi:uncharacterized phage protein gp47/JayE
MCSAITASAQGLIDVSIGSILRAMIEANAAIALWLQWLIGLTLQMTRAATCTDSDLDSWMADFSFIRRPASSATGTVTLSRNSAAVGSAVPAGAVVKTSDGSVSFTITSDVANSAWSATSSAYVMPIGLLSIDLPIAASNPGASGNVVAGSITLLASPISGVDSATNAFATGGGADAETDDAFRARFSAFLAALSRATRDAISYAISGAAPDIKYLILENTDGAGGFRPGNIVAIVDNGTGTIGSDLFSSLTTAIGAVRGVGTTFSILPAGIVQVTVSMTLALPSGVSTSSVQGSINSAITGYFGMLEVGAQVSVTKVSQAAYSADARILNISGITLNGSSVDLEIEPTCIAYCQSIGLN